MNLAIMKLGHNSLLCFQVFNRTDSFPGFSISHYGVTAGESRQGTDCIERSFQVIEFQPALGNDTFTCLQQPAVTQFTQGLLSLGNETCTCEQQTMTRLLQHFSVLHQSLTGVLLA